MNEDTTATTDAGPTGANPQQPLDLGKIEQATERAIDQHSAETKRKPGQRGPDKSPRRKKLPVDGLGNGSSSPLVDPGSPTRYEDEFPTSAAPAPAFDQATAEAFTDLGLTIYTEARQIGMVFFAEKRIGDAAIAESCIKPISPKLETQMRRVGVVLVQKYAAILQYSPEWALALCVGLVAVGDIRQIQSAAAQRNQLSRNQSSGAA